MESMYNADFVTISPSTLYIVHRLHDRITQMGNVGFHREQLKATSGTNIACGENLVVGLMECTPNADIVGVVLEEFTRAFPVSKMTRAPCFHETLFRLTSYRVICHEICAGIREKIEPVLAEFWSLSL